MTDLALAPPELRKDDPSPPDDLIRSVLDQLGGDPRLVHVRQLPARTARYADLSRPLPSEVDLRIPHSRLWAHQAQAIDLARDGRSFALASGTSSGKSLTYQVPIAEAALDGATALVIYPTKALAQDQLLSFGSWGLPEMVAATYDGDCGHEERLWVREHANVLLTNPEMLHLGILANHRRWVRVLRSLRFVVVDELHLLRGVFGTHVAQVLRRLRRLVRHYGGVEPTFVFTSATIGEADVLASQLCGLPVVGITGDEAPTGDRHVALWQPRADDGQRWSLHGEAARVAEKLIAAGLRTLVFCASRRGTELVAEDLRRSLPGTASEAIRAYRSGYLPSERREIEADLFSGRLRGVVSTSALELGVDIGGLDAVVLCGFPGTVASFWQQVGRSGRSQRPSLAVLVAGEDQLDQWMVRNPDQLFERAPEPAVINLDNPHVYTPHLGCAAHEAAVRHTDHAFWPDQLDDAVRRLVLDERATVRHRRDGPAVVWSGRGLPAPTIGLRSASRGEYRIIEPSGRTIGTVDESRVSTAVHTGAIYLHQGRAWHVVDLDDTDRVAHVEPSNGEHYTRPRSNTSIRLLEVDRTRPVGTSRLRLGSVEVITEVTGYQTRSASSHELLGSHSLERPPSQLSTRAIWYTFDEDTLGRADVGPDDLPGTLHAAEHAGIGILPLFTICDRWDVGGVSTPWLPETNAPTIVIHDAHPGGAGIAELAYDAAQRHLPATLAVVAQCPCTSGCPSCVQSPKCGNNNEPLDKHGAARLLGATLDR